jgi:hypothetical protein
LGELGRFRACFAKLLWVRLSHMNLEATVRAHWWVSRITDNGGAAVDDTGKPGKAAGV